MEKEKTTKFFEDFQTWRKNKPYLTASEIATRLGVSTTALAHFAAGRGRVTDEVFLKFYSITKEEKKNRYKRIEAYKKMVKLAKICKMQNQNGVIVSTKPLWRKCFQKTEPIQLTEQDFITIAHSLCVSTHKNYSPEETRFFLLKATAKTITKKGV